MGGRNNAEPRLVSTCGIALGVATGAAMLAGCATAPDSSQDSAQGLATIESFDNTEFLQMGFATVTLDGDDLKETGVEGTLDGIGQNLGEMMLEPRVIESTEDSRVWVIDLKNVLYAPETKDFETELPRTVAEGVPAPAVVKYTVKPSGFCQGTTHIPKGSPLRDDPIATYFLNMIPLGTLWYGKR